MAKMMRQVNLFGGIDLVPIDEPGTKSEPPPAQGGSKQDELDTTTPTTTNKPAITPPPIQYSLF